MLRHRPSVALVFLNPRHRNGGDAHDTPPNTSFANPIVRSIDNFSLIVRILLSRKYVCRHLMFVPPVPSGRFAMPDETSALTTISSVLGGLSAFGSLLVVLSYILFVECRSLSRQLVSILALCDLGQGLFFIISPFVGNGNCAAQALFGIWIASSSFLWTASIAYFVHSSSLFPPAVSMRAARF